MVGPSSLPFAACAARAVASAIWKACRASALSPESGIEISAPR
jgi:hypothetical protein